MTDSTLVPAEALPPLAGGRYELQGILGQGGMATVYLGYDTALRVHRAIKILAPHIAHKKNLRDRFENEARTMARLTHANVVAVQDVGQDGAQSFIVMELIQGGTPWDWVEDHGPMPARMVLDLLVPVLDALGAAHDAGVVHRDIKPQNILLTHRGRPKVTDFGIARVSKALEIDTMTRTGMAMGTWGYMAPEQRRSARDVDGRADVYAVGATFWALIKGESPVDLFAAEMDRRMLAGIPEPVAEIISRATRYVADDRYADVFEMQDACRAAIPLIDPLPDDIPPLAQKRELPFAGSIHSRPPASTPGVPATDETFHTDEPAPAVTAETFAPAESDGTFYTDVEPELDSPQLDSALPTESDAVPSPPTEVAPPAEAPRQRPIAKISAIVLLALIGAALGRTLLKGDPQTVTPATPAATAPAAAPATVDAPAEADSPSTPAEPVTVPAESAESRPADIKTTRRRDRSDSRRERREVRATPVVTRTPTPAVAPTPTVSTPEPAPAAAPEPPEAPPPKPTAPARVSFSGDAEHVSLIGTDGKQHHAGEVPAGTYKIMARFPGRDTDSAAGSITLASGQSKTIQCFAAFMKCQ